MANLHLVTGYQGSNHIKAADHGAFNAAIFGSGNYILPLGDQFAATLVSNNLVRIGSGEMLMQGRHIRLGSGDTVDLTIDNGSNGANRIDFIVVRYTRNVKLGTESANLVVVKGNTTTGTPQEPEVTTGDIINDAAATNDVPLYRIPITGISVGEPELLVDIAASIPELCDKIAAKLDDSTVADYVIGQGTDLGWKWRKWKSGRKECWFASPFTCEVKTSAGGGGFYVSPTCRYNFPLTFETIDNYQISGGANSANANSNVFWRFLSVETTNCVVQAVSTNGAIDSAEWLCSIYISGT